MAVTGHLPSVGTLCPVTGEILYTKFEILGLGFRVHCGACELSSLASVIWLSLSLFPGGLDSSSKQKKRKNERLGGGEGSCRLDRGYPDSGNDGRRRHRYAELGGPSAQLVSAFAFLLSLRASPSHTGTLQKNKILSRSNCKNRENSMRQKCFLFFFIVLCPPISLSFYCGFPLFSAVFWSPSLLGFFELATIMTWRSLYCHSGNRNSVQC